MTAILPLDLPGVRSLGCSPRLRLPARPLCAPPAALLAALLLCACGGGATSTGTVARTSAHPPTTPGARRGTHKSPPRASPVLRVSATYHLPAPRSGAAAAAYGPGVLVIGGLDPATVSTSTVFAVGPTGRAAPAAALPGAVHDAAATAVGGRVLLFGGGASEGSDRVIQVQPGTPRQVGRLPVALSDLDAVTVGHDAYVVGGWDGSTTNAAIFAVTPAGQVSTVGHLPLGVRYPATGVLDGKIIVAGGETTDGSPTSDVWSFDPASGRVSRLPALPQPGDHAAGAVLHGTFYVISGLIRGALTSRILALLPGGGWLAAGHLPQALNNPTAAPLAGGLAVFGGRGASGTTSSITLLRAG